MGALPQPRGVIDRPILELLTFGSNRAFGLKPAFSIFFGRFSIYLAPSGAKYCKKGVGIAWDYCLEGYVGRIPDFSGHLKSANPDFSDFGSKLVNFGQLLP